MTDSTFTRNLAESLFTQTLSKEFGLTITIKSLFAVPSPAVHYRNILMRFRAEFRPRFDSVTIDLSRTDPDSVLWLINQPNANLILGNLKDPQNQNPNTELQT